MVRGIMLAGTAAALMAAAGAGAAQDDRWKLLSSDREGRYLYDPANVVRDGDRVTFTIKIVFAESDSWATGMADYEIDCAAGTNAMRKAEIFDAAGTLLRSVTTPPERIRHEPLWAGGWGEKMYRQFCPGGKPLPAFPQGAPPIATKP